MYRKFDWNLVKGIIAVDEDRIRFVWAGFPKDWEETKFMAWQGPGWACDVLDWEDDSPADTNCDEPSIQVEYRDGTKTGLLPVGKAAFLPETKGEGETTTMAMKTPTATKATETPATTTTEVPAETSNALAALGNLQLFNIDPPKQSGDLLPQVKIVSPVEVDGTTFRGVDANQIGLYDGSKFEPLPAPFKMMVLAARKATRKLVITTGEDGKEKKSYERGFAPMGAGFDASAALYEQHMNDNSTQKGISRIVAVVKDGGVVIAEFPTFLVNVDLWGPSLHQARDGRAALVKVSQLEAFLTPSKKNPLNKYIDPKKFNKPENVCNVDLTHDELVLIKDAFTAAQDKFLAWCKR